MLNYYKHDKMNVKIYEYNDFVHYIYKTHSDKYIFHCYEQGDRVK